MTVTFLTNEDKTLIDNEINNLSLNKADKNYVITVFEELKTLIQNGKTDSAIAVLDEAILDLTTLA